MGEVTLNSARKDGSTQIYWFYLTTERRKGVLFDIRELAKATGKAWVAETCADMGPQWFESFLQSELDRACQFCADNINQLKGILK